MSSSPLTILGAFAIYGLVHSILTSDTAKGFGELIMNKRYYRLFFNIFATLTLIPILALPVLLPDQPWYAIPAPYATLAQAGQALSLILLTYSVIQTGALNFLGIEQLYKPKSDSPPKLNTSGLYRYIRHPLYTFSMILLWLTPTMTTNTAAFYLAISLYFIIGGYNEEKKLVNAFGDDYIAYQQKTGMFLPIK